LETIGESHLRVEEPPEAAIEVKGTSRVEPADLRGASEVPEDHHPKEGDRGLKRNGLPASRRDSRSCPGGIFLGASGRDRSCPRTGVVPRKEVRFPPPSGQAGVPRRRCPPGPWPRPSGPQRARPRGTGGGTSGPERHGRDRGCGSPRGDRFGESQSRTFTHRRTTVALLLALVLLGLLELPTPGVVAFPHRSLLRVSRGLFIFCSTWPCRPCPLSPVGYDTHRIC